MEEAHPKPRAKIVDHEVVKSAYLRSGSGRSMQDDLVDALFC
jgi:hypothetical protein